MSQEAESPKARQVRRGMGWQRIVLWTLFVVLGGACLWMWWAMGRIQEAVEKQGKITPQQGVQEGRNGEKVEFEGEAKP